MPGHAAPVFRINVNSQVFDIRRRLNPHVFVVLLTLLEVEGAALVEKLASVGERRQEVLVM